MYDQLFSFENKIYMVEQKIRDDHDSTKKRGQFNNFVKKVECLKEIYKDKEIISIMWFIDPSLTKNRGYYRREMILKAKENNVEMQLFYGSDFFCFLDKINVWEELKKYIQEWKKTETTDLLLDFEYDWEDTKKELLEKVSKSQWKKIFSNKLVMEMIIPILFPTNKYLEIKNIIK